MSNYCKCCGTPCAKSGGGEGSNSGSCGIDDTVSIQQFKKIHNRRCQMSPALIVSMHVWMNGSGTPVCDDCLAIGLDVIRSRLASMPTRAPELTKLDYFPHHEMLFRMRDLLDEAVNGRRQCGVNFASCERSYLAQWISHAQQLLRDLPLQLPDDFEREPKECNCPECRSEAYLGLNVVECSNEKCRHYVPGESGQLTDSDDDHLPRVQFFRDLTKAEEFRANISDALLSLVNEVFYSKRKPNKEWYARAETWIKARERAVKRPPETAVVE